MRKLDHCNIVRLRYFFYSSGEKVRLGAGSSAVRGWECCPSPHPPSCLLLPGLPGSPPGSQHPSLAHSTCSRASTPFSCCLQKDELYLNLVLEYVPETVYRVARHFTKAKLTIPIIYVKVGRWQEPRSPGAGHPVRPVCPAPDGALTGQSQEEA